MNRCTCLLLIALLVGLNGCAAKADMQEPLPPVPLPPQSTLAAAPAPELAEGQTLTVYLPADAAERLRHGEPDELAALLEMKGTSEKETAVSRMRPTAIREAAQLVTFQTAIAWRYKQLVAATEQHSSIMDTAFNFGPLLMTQGDALILPPVLTRAGASMRIEAGDTATAVDTSYELLEPARYVATAPHWREFLMTDGFPEPEKPHPAVIPKNDKERGIWRAAVREAWAQGVTEADQLFTDNVSRMVRQYRGVMLYHLLTAQHLLSRVSTASAKYAVWKTEKHRSANNCCGMCARRCIKRRTRSKTARCRRAGCSGRGRVCLPFPWRQRRSLCWGCFSLPCVAPA